jgi:hypothetical protein
VARGAKPLEVDGLAKPTAARVMSLARGGQTLLTPEAREDLGKTVLKTQSHGHWQIKGVADPIELFEVGFPEDRFVAPSDSDKVFRVVKTGDWWMPVKEIPNNLPHQGTQFVGREREIDEVKAHAGQRGWSRCWAWAGWARRGCRCRWRPSSWRCTPTACGSSTCRR